MTAHEYLKELLSQQSIPAQAMEQLQQTRAVIEQILRRSFGSAPRIYYAGSYGKNTMIAAYYDLDIVIYFPADTGGTLKDTYWAVCKSLSDAGCRLKQKDVAIRIPISDRFYVDVVPGRAIDNGFEYANLYRSEVDSWLQTSIKRHIEVINESGLRGTMRLMKLWNVRHSIGVRSIALELLTIRALGGQQVSGYDKQLWTLFQFLHANMQSIRLVDPANSNNIITDVVPLATKKRVVEQAAAALSARNWQEVIW